MGNQVSSKIVDIGDITMTTSIGCKQVLKDMKHVPNMRLTNTSAGKVDDANLVNLFGGGKWRLANGSFIVVRGVMEGSLYIVQGNLCKGEVNFVHYNSTWSCDIGGSGPLTGKDCKSFLTKSLSLI